MFLPTETVLFLLCIFSLSLAQGTQETVTQCGVREVIEGSRNDPFRETLTYDMITVDISSDNSSLNMITGVYKANTAGLYQVTWATDPATWFVNVLATDGLFISGRGLDDDRVTVSM